MNWKINGYSFEVERSEKDDKGFIKVDSLSSALANISSDGWIRAKYNLEIDGRITSTMEIDLQKKDIAHLNGQQILDLLGNEIKIKHNL